MKRLAWLLLLPLFGCASPRESCVVFGVPIKMGDIYAVEQDSHIRYYQITNCVWNKDRTQISVEGRRAR